jgi:hypothetical protein
LNDGELVTADARNRVRLTQEPAKPIGYLLDEEVSGSVSVGIVDQLESIEIKHQQRKLLFIAPEPPDGTIKPVLQKRPVGETGKRIMNCLVLRAGLSVLQLYDKLHQRPVKQGHDEYGSDGGRKQDRQMAVKSSSPDAASRFTTMAVAKFVRTSVATAAATIGGPAFENTTTPALHW